MPHAQIEERAVVILGRKAKGLLAYEEVLAELADADCVSALAAVISERTRLRPELVQRALEADSDEPISVMCCAAGFKMNSCSALLRMRRRQGRGLDSAPTQSLNFFSGLTRASAERLLPRLVAGLADQGIGR
jgi:Uncharacterised protein conserved in bacteria (DUF2336)